MIRYTYCSRQDSNWLNIRISISPNPNTTQYFFYEKWKHKMAIIFRWYIQATGTTSQVVEFAPRGWQVPSQWNTWLPRSLRGKRRHASGAMQGRRPRGDWGTVPQNLRWGRPMHWSPQYLEK